MTLVGLIVTTMKEQLNSASLEEEAEKMCAKLIAEEDESQRRAEVAPPFIYFFIL